MIDFDPADVKYAELVADPFPGRSTPHPATRADVRARDGQTYAVIVTAVGTEARARALDVLRAADTLK